ncbi:hypothetical protein [Neomegalonema sp.]|uniref:hypothetical protein n=1 Tax=Neomegalonema sp. TaxID=2039713 RepID=UPI002639D5A0|nr:hypothetical protein [Neomegalonema sp.]MDD2867058.1 hypothetical protein [Neomegalonema sp.]
MKRLRLAATLALWAGVSAAPLSAQTPAVSPAPAPAPASAALSFAPACPRFQVIWGVPDKPLIPARRFCACISEKVRDLAETYPDMPVTAAALSFTALDPTAAQAAEEAYGSGAPSALLSRHVYGFAALSAAAESCAPLPPAEAEEPVPDEDPPEGFEPPAEDAP